MITTTAREAEARRLTSTLLWAPQVLLAAFFLLAAAAPKWRQHPPVPGGRKRLPTPRPPE